VCRPELHDALLGIAENRSANAFDLPSLALPPPSPRVPADVFTKVQLLAIGTFRNLLNYSEEFWKYSSSESRFPSLCSKVPDDRSSPCEPSVIVELLKTVSVLVAHRADPVRANDPIPCVDIFLQVLAINR
jgi:hypothetical protein